MISSEKVLLAVSIIYILICIFLTAVAIINKVWMAAASTGFIAIFATVFIIYANRKKK